MFASILFFIIGIVGLVLIFTDRNDNTSAKTEWIIMAILGFVAGIVLFPIRESW